MEIRLKPGTMVVLVGSTSAGKSTFARKNFKPDAVLSSDAFRLMISGDENDQTVSGDAFRLLYEVLRLRLVRGLLTVVDATSLKTHARKDLLAIAIDHHAPICAIVFDMDKELLLERNRSRGDRHIPDWVIEQHCRLLQEALPLLPQEFDRVYTLYDQTDADEARVVIDEGQDTNNA